MAIDGIKGASAPLALKGLPEVNLPAEPDKGYSIFKQSEIKPYNEPKGIMA